MPALGLRSSRGSGGWPAHGAAVCRGAGPCAFGSATALPSLPPGGSPAPSHHGSRTHEEQSGSRASALPSASGAHASGLRNGFSPSLTRRPVKPRASPLLSFRVEEWSKFRAGDVTRGLAENGPAGAGVKFRVVRDSKRLLLAAGAETAQFNVASALGANLKAKSAEDGNDFRAGESLKPRQEWPPFRM